MLSPEDESEDEDEVEVLVAVEAVELLEPVEVGVTLLLLEVGVPVLVAGGDDELGAELIGAELETLLAGVDMELIELVGSGTSLNAGPL